MPERESRQALTADPLRHPAVQSWVRSGTQRGQPQRVERLKRKAAGEVYRLVGAGPAGSAVIAKKCRPEKARLERMLFEDVLPRAGVSRLEFYGEAQEDDGRFCWLFLEDVGEQRYSPSSEEHRTLAAKWLADFHAAAQGMSVTESLPRLEPDHYLRFLQSTRSRIPSLAPALDPAQRDVLNGIDEQCAILEDSWSRIETFCAVMPRTIVHGDCLAKNVHVRRKSAAPEVVFFDWGGAGRGLVATDLGQLGLPRNGASMTRRDYTTYHELVKPRWSVLEVEHVERLAHLGQTFWALKVIPRELDAFGQPWTVVEDTVGNLEIYRSVLAASTSACRWNR